MPLLFSNPVFIDQFIRALSHTLIHSLWQGMLLAVVAGCMVYCTKKARPAFRYLLLSGALLIFIAGIAATFCIQFIPETSQAEIKKEMPVQAKNSMLFQPGSHVETSSNMVEKAVGIYNENATWIVLAWLIIIALRCMQLAAGLYGVYRLKNRQTFSPGEYWNKRINELCRRLQINSRVRLLQSGIAQVPAVIGYFKPVILFPAGLLASMPPAEVEAILIHELAHIRRKDFLVNLLQHFVEIIFFFNPAVWWVSSLIRVEREHCCDEIAVIQTDNKQNYINALLSFQGFDSRLVSPLANGLTNGKNHLMNRVKRIIYNNNKSLNNMEKKFLVAGLLLTSVFIVAFSSNNLQQMSTGNDSSQNNDIPFTGKILPGLVVVNDTVPDKVAGHPHDLNGTINSIENGKKYKIITEKNQVTELFVDGEKVPAEKIAGYKSITDKILEQSRYDWAQAEKEMELSGEQQLGAEKEMVQAKLEMEQAEIEMAEEMKKAAEEMEQVKLEMALIQKEMAEATVNGGKEQSRIHLEQSKKEMEEAKRELAHVQKQIAEAADAGSEQARLILEQSKLEMEQAKLEIENAKKEVAEEMEQAKLEMKRAEKELESSRKEMMQSKKDMEDSKKLQENIVIDLIKEKIIKNKSELDSFKLSNTELIVNGVKQPGGIHKKFKDKYVKGSTWTMAFNYDNGR